MPLFVLAVCAAGVPLVLLASGVVRGATHAPEELLASLAVPMGVLGRTLAVAGIVSTLACVLGWPTARVLARGRGVWVVLCMSPLLMPPYLAYAGWSQVRAPGSWLGDRLAHLASEGHAWASEWTGYALAVIGLAAWASPLAGVMVAGALARTERSLGQTLRLDAGMLARERVRLASVRGALVRAWLVVGLVAIGSAVPMHLAQVETLAIRVWRGIAASGPDAWWVQTVRSWPVFVGVLAAAAWFARAVGAAGGDDVEPDGSGPRASWGVRVCAVGVWLLGAGVPLGLFAMNIAPGVHASWVAVRRWWAIGGSDVVDSAMIASCVGSAGMAIAASASLAVGSSMGGAGRGRRVRVVVGLAGAVLAVGAAVPGILVGVALARVPELGAGGLVWAHACRFGVVAMSAGVLAAIAEPAARREARVFDDAGSLRAWWWGCVPLQWPVFVGAGLACAVLSFHEIEASVILTPPGLGSFAQQTLEHLHFFRERELAASITATMTLAMLASVGAVALAWVGLGRRGGNHGRSAPVRSVRDSD